MNRLASIITAALALGAGCAESPEGIGPDLGCETCDVAAEQTIVRGRDVPWMRCWVQPAEYAFTLEDGEYYDELICERAAGAIAIDPEGRVGENINSMSADARASEAYGEVNWRGDDLMAKRVVIITNVFDDIDQSYPLSLNLDFSIFGGRNLSASYTIKQDEGPTMEAPLVVSMPYDLWPLSFSEMTYPTLTLAPLDIAPPEPLATDDDLGATRSIKPSSADDSAPRAVAVPVGYEGSATAELKHRADGEWQTVEVEITGPGEVSAAGFTPGPPPSLAFE